MTRSGVTTHTDRPSVVDIRKGLSNLGNLGAFKPIVGKCAVCSTSGNFLHRPEKPNLCDECRGFNNLGNLTG